MGTAIRHAESQRNEIISADVLNNIVVKLLEVYEGYRQEMFDSHVKYELSKFLNKGLRPDYKIELNLFTTEEITRQLNEKLLQTFEA